MDPVRRLATDPPARSAALDVGPHLLGRIYAPDPRDWSVARLLEVAVPSGGRRVQAPVPPGDAASCDTANRRDRICSSSTVMFW